MDTRDDAKNPRCLRESNVASIADSLIRNDYILQVSFIRQDFHAQPAANSVGKMFAFGLTRRTGQMRVHPTGTDDDT